MICKKCGDEVKEGENFCGKCGKKINNNSTNKKMIYILIPIISMIIVVVGIVLVVVNNKIENNDEDIGASNGVENKEHTDLDNETFNDTEIAEYNENTNTVNTKIDIDRFIKELSYSSMSTVHNNDYGGDGYRTDYNFYTSELTKSDFNIKNEGNTTIYTLNTDGNSSCNYSFTLEITIMDKDILQEIKISCRPTTLNVREILNCAEEVEDALGYTLYNKRINVSAYNVSTALREQNIIDSKSNVIVTDKKITIDNQKYGQDVIFEIENNTISYCITNIKDTITEKQTTSNQDSSTNNSKDIVKSVIDSYAKITTKHDGYDLQYMGYTQYARSKNGINVYMIRYLAKSSGMSTGLEYCRLISLNSTNTMIDKKSEFCKWATNSGAAQSSPLLKVQYNQIWGN